MGSRALFAPQAYHLGTGTFEPLQAKRDTSIMRLSMELSDLIYVLFLVICCWLSVNFDAGSGGGGKRSRAQAPC